VRYVGPGSQAQGLRSRIKLLGTTRSSRIPYWDQKVKTLQGNIQRGRRVGRSSRTVVSLSQTLRSWLCFLYRAATRRVGTSDGARATQYVIRETRSAVELKCFAVAAAGSFSANNICFFAQSSRSKADHQNTLPRTESDAICRVCGLLIRKSRPSLNAVLFHNTSGSLRVVYGRVVSWSHSSFTTPETVSLCCAATTSFLNQLPSRSTTAPPACERF
jgi:hypothetical protein